MGNPAGDYFQVRDTVTGGIITVCSLTTATKKLGKLFPEAKRVNAVADGTPLGGHSLSLLFNGSSSTEEQVETFSKAFVQLACVIESHLQNEKDVIVFCKSGRSRSSSLLVAFFYLFRGFSITDCQKWLEGAYAEQRPQNSHPVSFDKFSPIFEYLKSSVGDRKLHEERWLPVLVTVRHCADFLNAELKLACDGNRTKAPRAKRIAESHPRELPASAYPAFARRSGTAAHQNLKGNKFTGKQKDTVQKKIIQKRNAMASSEGENKRAMTDPIVNANLKRGSKPQSKQKGSVVTGKQKDTVQKKTIQSENKRAKTDPIVNANLKRGSKPQSKQKGLVATSKQKDTVQKKTIQKRNATSSSEGENKRAKIDPIANAVSMRDSKPQSKQKGSVAKDSKTFYEGDPSSINIYVEIRALGTIDFSHSTHLYRFDGKRYSEMQLLQFLVKNGIPGIDAIPRENTAALTECVKFAHVDRTHITSARSNVEGYSSEILSDTSVEPVLEHFGFERVATDGEVRYYQPGGRRASKRSMKLRHVRVFIRENDCWHASSRTRLRMKPGDSLLLFSLRLWGATSPKPLPTYGQTCASVSTDGASDHERPENEATAVASEEGTLDLDHDNIGPSEGTSMKTTSDQDKVVDEDEDVVMEEELEAKPAASVDHPNIATPAKEEGSPVRATREVSPTEITRQVSLSPSRISFKTKMDAMSKSFDSLDHEEEQALFKANISRWETEPGSAIRAWRCPLSAISSDSKLSFKETMDQCSRIFDSLNSDEQVLFKMTASRW